MTSQEIITVQAWHNALNSSNKEKLSALVREDVKIGGPRGSVKGVGMMLEWVDRAKVTFTPQRYFRQNEVIVVEALGEWHAPEMEEITSSQTVATVFVVEDHLISSISRYDSLKEAFEASGVSEMSEVEVQL